MLVDSISKVSTAQAPARVGYVLSRHARRLFDNALCPISIVGQPPGGVKITSHTHRPGLSLENSIGLTSTYQISNDKIDLCLVVLNARVSRAFSGALCQ